MAAFLNISASSSRRIDSVDSMESGMTSSEDFASAPPVRLTPKRLFAVGAGLLGVAGCAAAVLHGSTTSAGSSVEQISARSLLEHPDFIDVAANNVWSVAGHHLAGKEHKLRPAMHEVMSKVTKILDEHDPEGGRQLESVKLTHQQKADVLSMVKRMSDKHVQKVGKEILDIAVKHQSDKESALENMQSEISSAFQPRLAELQDLKSSVVPASLRRGEDTFQADVPVEQRRRLSSHCTGDDSECHPGSEITPAMAKGMNMKMEDALGVVGALLEQARLALDESAVIGSSFGSNHHVPYYWRSLIGGAAFGVETMDCFMRQNDVHKTVDGKSVLVNGNSNQVNSVKMSMCPMKYAGAGMDFLSGLNNAAGIQNTRLPQDFQMMFGGHAQQPQAGFNPYGAQHAAGLPNPLAMLMPQQQQPTAHPLTHLAHGFLQGAMQGTAAAPAAAPAAGQAQAHPFAYAR